MQDQQNQAIAGRSLIWEWFKHQQVHGLPADTAAQSAASDRARQADSHDESDHWLHLWNKSLQQIFNMPQIGLARVYQEKMNQANETYYQFQTALTKFCLLLSTPLERAGKQVCEQLTQHTDQKPSPDVGKVYYDRWIKQLEKQYQELFNTAEYIQTLTQTVESMNAFVGARDAVVTDALKTLPIPSNSDMDALYLELYHLKKRIKRVEKAIADNLDRSDPVPDVNGEAQ